MADEEENTGRDEKEVDEREEGEEGAEGEGGGKSKKKLLLIVVLLVVVLGGAAAGLVISGVLAPSDHADGDIDPLLAPKTVFYELDEFLTNLNEPGKKISFLKMKVTLELPNLKTQSAVESNLPRIRDAFQIYLRELRSTDIQGSSGLHRLREELLLRINKILESSDVEVNDILFREIVVQ